MKTKITLVFVYLALLTFALADGHTLLLRLLFLAALVLTGSYLWAGYNSRRVSIKMSEPPEHCQVGEKFDLTFSVSNDGRLPQPSLRLAHRTDFTGEQNARLIDLPARGQSTWQTEIHCQRRGYHRLGALRVTGSDPLGLFTRARTVGEPREILVYPRTVALPFFEHSSADLPGYGFGNRFSSQIGPGASSVRDYQPGDSFSHVHWQSTARTGNLMVKVFDADRAQRGFENVWLIMDLNRNYRRGEGTETTEEYAVSIAASLLQKYGNSGTQVGLAAAGDRPHLILPDWGETHFHRMMTALSVIKADGALSLDQFLLRESETLKGNAMTVLITSSDAQTVVTACHRLRILGNLVVAVLLDAGSFGGSGSALNTRQRLAASGISAYVVRQGDDLARALDNRTFTAPARRN